MTSSQTSDSQRVHTMEPQVIVTVILALLLPGAGHLFMKKLWRAGVYFLSIVSLSVAGLFLEGTLFSLLRLNAKDGFLQLLASIGNLGLGMLHFLFHWLGLGYGDATVRTNEYGTTFLIVAALLNILVVLNALDIAVGEKE